MLKGFGPTEPARPQYYNVACAAGHRLHGQRTEGYQALRCPECGEGIFVLPRSPLPEPPAPPTARTRSPVSGRSSAIDDAPIALTDPPAPMGEPEAEVEWLDPVPSPSRGEGRVGADV